MPSSWIEALRNFDCVELDGIRPGQPDRFGDTVFLDESADDCAALTIDARLDAGVIANRDEARLDRADHTIGVFTDENIAVVDVHPHELTGCAHHALRNEVAHHANNPRV